MDVIENKKNAINLSRLSNHSYIINFYRKKIIGRKIVLTTDHGSWIALSKKEYNRFLNNNISTYLYNDLETRGIIITKNNYKSIIQEFYNRYSYLEYSPALHIIVPTRTCNLKCIYCHSKAVSDGKIEYKMSEKTLKKILYFIFRSPSKFIKIEFNGGEPLLNKGMIKKTFQYVEELSKKYKKNYNITIVSNLTTMTKSFLHFLVKQKNNLSISTSLDGPEVVHNMNRRYAGNNKGTYKKVTEWIRCLSRNGISVGLLMVVTKYSLPYWKEIIDEYINWGIRKMYVKPLVYVGYAKDEWEKIAYTPEEFVSFWKKCVDYTFELVEKDTIISEFNLLFGLQNVLTTKNNGFLDFTNPCGAIRGQLTYDDKGDIYSCNLAKIFNEYKIGNVYESIDYNTILNSNKSKEIILSSMLEGYYCDSCVYKPFCSICPVAYYGENDDLNIKINKNRSCLIHKAMYDYIFKKIIYESSKVKRYLSKIGGE